MGLDEYADRLIRIKARQLARRPEFQSWDPEDIEQELTLDLLQRLLHHDPARASRNTFIARAVEHKVASLIEHRTRTKRHCPTEMMSLDDPASGEDGEIVPRSETIDPATLQRVPTPSDTPELAVDLALAMEDLPDDMRDLCERLRTETVSEIARRLGIPRSTLYESIRRLRQRLSERGLGGIS
jgi:RNA polymerase sigma-70 factor (ECF subfamily)